MAFERLQKLGTSRFQKIVNDLARGVPAMAVARMVQLEWHEYTDVAEKTLTQQLNRLRLKMAEGALGPAPQEQLQSIAKALPNEPAPKKTTLELANFAVVDKMTELCLKAERRVERLLDKEQAMPLPIAGLNEIMRDYADFLLKLQKMRFELGIDEFKGPLTTVKGAAERVQYPDGTNVQREVYEACGVADKIFERHGIEA